MRAGCCWRQSSCPGTRSNCPQIHCDVREAELNLSFISFGCSSQFIYVFHSLNPMDGQIKLWWSFCFFDTFMGQGQDDPRADGSVPSRGRQSQTANRWLKKSLIRTHFWSRCTSAFHDNSLMHGHEDSTFYILVYTTPTLKCLDCLH
jgi:hypothetical protein